MIETLILLSSSSSLMFATLGILWVFRCKGNVRSQFGLFSLIIFVYAVWYFMMHIDVTSHNTELIVNNLFITLTACMNAYYACHLKLTLNVNRRKCNIGYNKKERRKR